MVPPGPPTARRKPRQAWKGATVVESGCGGPLFIGSAWAPQPTRCCWGRVGGATRTLILVHERARRCSSARCADAASVVHLGAWERRPAQDGGARPLRGNARGAHIFAARAGSGQPARRASERLAFFTRETLMRRVHPAGCFRLDASFRLNQALRENTRSRGCDDDEVSGGSSRCVARGYGVRRSDGSCRSCRSCR